MRSFVVQVFFSFFRTLFDYLRHLDVFIIVPFVSSIGLEIVAEADLLGGNFLSEKSCFNSVVSTSFWSWLLNASSVLTHLSNTQRCFFGFLMRLWVY